MTLPAGWTAKSVVMNHPGIEPAVSGGVYTWQLNDLPYIEDEESSPSWSAISPRIAVAYFPPAGSSAAIRPLADWPDVARWMAELADPKASPSAAIEAKAKSLTDGAKTEFEKIQALGRYVQATNYVAIQMGLGRGGGYTPHAASDVFLKGWVVRIQAVVVNDAWDFVTVLEDPVGAVCRQCRTVDEHVLLRV